MVVMDSENKSPPAEKAMPEHQATTEAHTTGLHVPAHGHNASSQHDVSQNPDLALNYSHEHQHQHLHHSRRSIQGRDDEVVYSQGDDADKSNIPDQNAQDSHHQAHHTAGKTAGKSGIIQTDAEKGVISPGSLSQEEDDPRTHKFLRFYDRWKILFHATSLASMTGYAVVLAHCIVL
jgi:concentrative nucleoside transporter, CNT family